jgi:hypothetical protein
MSFKSFIASLGLLVLAVAVGIARPRADEVTGFWRGGACASSVEGMCKEFELDPMQVLKCLHSHLSLLPRECHKDVSALELDQEGVPERCRADVVEHCSKVEPGDGHVLACLKRKRLQLAPGCRVALEEMPKANKK